MSKIIVCLAAAAALAAPALAETPSENFAFRFSFDQSQLAGPDGAARVHHQLRIEASRACWVGAPSVMRFVDQKCRDRLVETAVKRINNPMLTQVHAGATAVASN